MAVKWDELFGSDFLITLTNEERRYLALDPIEDSWDVTQYVSKCNVTYVRTTAYWEGNIIKKVIREEKRLVDIDQGPIWGWIREDDTMIQTENREKIIPLTSRGKLKPVNATNITSVNPSGCTFYFRIDNRSSNHPVTMSISNYRNCKKIAIGENEKVASIKNEDDFHSFMQYYISTCPDNYFDRIRVIRTAKHQTVKYKTGDIFRVEIDRFHYCYGLITGELRKILKWSDLPKWHSLRKLMTVPIMIRFYDHIFDSPDLGPEELSNYPLGRLSICSDCDIIWGTHTIVGHKTLTEDDIEFGLVCTKVMGINEHITTHTYDMFVNDGIIPNKDGYQLYVEWGLASVMLPFECISEKLKSFLDEYHDPHGGVNISIIPDIEKSWYSTKMDLLNPWNSEMREELFRCLKLNPDADFDEFAAAFNGPTKKEILERLMN